MKLHPALSSSSYSWMIIFYAGTYLIFALEFSYGLRSLISQLVFLVYGGVFGWTLFQLREISRKGGAQLKWSFYPSWSSDFYKHKYREVSGANLVRAVLFCVVIAESLTLISSKPAVRSQFISMFGTEAVQQVNIFVISGLLAVAYGIWLELGNIQNYFFNRYENLFVQVIMFFPYTMFSLIVSWSLRSSFYFVACLSSYFYTANSRKHDKASQFPSPALILTHAVLLMIIAVHTY